MSTIYEYNRIRDVRGGILPLFVFPPPRGSRLCSCIDVDRGGGKEGRYCSTIALTTTTTATNYHQLLLLNTIKLLLLL